jgi:hypothetical protein
MSQSLTERYDERIAGMLSCDDRLVITGTLPVVCYAAGMTGYLNADGIRIFDYPQFAMTLRDRVRERAASLATAAGITIEHIGKPCCASRPRPMTCPSSITTARWNTARGRQPGSWHRSRSRSTA